MDLYREVILRSHVHAERGVADNAEGADDGQPEPVVIVEAGAFDSLEGVKEAVNLLWGVTNRHSRAPARPTVTDG